MLGVGEIFPLLGFWHASIVAIVALIGGWLLTGGLEWCKKEWKFLESAVLMPGPPALPIIGNALHFACKGDELLDKIVELGTPYDNPFRFWMAPKLFVIVKNPRDIGVVMNSPIATHKAFEYRFLGSFLGRGIVTDSGSTHRAHRKLIMPMVNGKVLGSFLESFDRQSRRCVECLASRVDTGEFDILDYMDDCTLDIILETIMGTPGTAQEGGYKGLIDNSKIGSGLAHERTMKAWLWTDWIYARLKPGRQFAKAMEVMHEFVENLVAQKKEEYSQSDISNESPTAVLDRLTAHNQETKLLDDKRLRDEIANIWIPAQDPTAITSAFLFMMLGMHEEVQDKVRAEVNEVIGDGDITLEQISKLRYLEMVLKETIRLFPVGPIILRELQDDLEFETCSAPKGCSIAVFLYLTHRHPAHWKNPDKFDPERFTPENSAGRHPYAFLPFSTGIRGCIGRAYATTFLKTVVARIVQNYKITSKGSLETLRLKAGVSVLAIEGYNVSISRL